MRTITLRLITAALLLLPQVSQHSAAQRRPLVYRSENTAPAAKPIPLLEMMQLPVRPMLPDPFAWYDGSGRSTDFKDWERHRSEIIQLLEHYEIGQKPRVGKQDVKAFLRNDTLFVDVAVGPEILRLTAAIHYPKGQRKPRKSRGWPAVIGIMAPYGQLPQHLFEERGVAGIAFNFSQVMKHTQVRGTEPINRLYPELTYMGAYSAWSWGVSRIIDGLEQVAREARIDLTHLGVTGCSFAGKMALFAGALDERIALTIAQEPGGGGVNAWRVSETQGNVERVGNTSYAWFIERMRQFAGPNVSRLPLDHHQLTALICPRALLVLGNPDYQWLCDQSGYVSWHAARHVWQTFGIADRIGLSIQGGHGHCQLPESQYDHVAAYIDRFLLDKKADTNIIHAPMFQQVDYRMWAPWLDEH